MCIWKIRENWKSGGRSSLYDETHVTEIAYLNGSAVDRFPKDLFELYLQKWKYAKIYWNRIDTLTIAVAGYYSIQPDQFWSNLTSFVM